MKKLVYLLLGLCTLWGITGCSDEDEIGNIDPEVLEQAVSNWEQVEEAMNPLFEESESATELSAHLEEIKAMEGVEDAWMNDDATAICVAIKNGGLSFYYYPSGSLLAPDEEILPQTYALETKAGDEDWVCGNKNVCIINQISEDSEYHYIKGSIKSVKNNFIAKGFKVNVINNEDFTVNTFVSKIPEYGIIYLITHGLYGAAYKGQDKLHWLLTGEQIRSKQDSADWRAWGGRDVAFVTRKELSLSGLMISKRYIAISENYLEQKMKNFTSNSILYNVACYSLKGNTKLRDIFMGKGLGCYLGFDDKNKIGVNRGSEFFFRLLTGETVGEAYNAFSEEEKYDDWGDANWILYPEDSKITLYEEPEISDNEAVDLGLSVKWASKNLGASNHLDLGKEYKDLDYTKVIEDYPNLVEEFGDNADISQTKYDYAHAELGSSWRMPTTKEWEELKDKCKWEAIVQDGVPGFAITGKTGNSIFIPSELAMESVVGTYNFNSIYASSILSYVGLKGVLLYGYIFSTINICNMLDAAVVKAYIRPVHE